MKKAIEIFGKILLIVGFFGLFFVSEDSWMLQVIWTASAALLILAGQKILDKIGALED